MTLPTFVHEGAAALRAGEETRLEGSEGHHAAVVRRIRVGEALRLTDGAGAVVLAEVVALGKATLDLRVAETRTVAAPAPRLVVVQALTKGDRGELAVEVLTEVGADVVVPWAAARSVVRWTGERGEKSLRRWRATAREAAKQSRRAWFPEVTAMAATADVQDLLSGAATAVVLHESAEGAVGDMVPAPDGDLVLVVGPEGGITEEELTAFRSAGASAVRLGDTVLRASTAGVVAAGALLSRTPRWS
jgi:16S rRNA (uracil1498-N3)-methyltransferase